MVLKIHRRVIRRKFLKKLFRVDNEKKKRSGNTGLEIHIGDIIIKKCREGITLTFEILTEDNVGVEYL